MWKWRASVACLLFFCFVFSTTEAAVEAPFSFVNIWLNLLRNTSCVKEWILKETTLYQLQSSCSMQIILKAVSGCLMRVRGWKDFSDNADPKAQLRSIRMQSQIATLDAHRQSRDSTIQRKNSWFPSYFKNYSLYKLKIHVCRRKVIRNN